MNSFRASFRSLIHPGLQLGRGSMGRKRAPGDHCVVMPSPEEGATQRPDGSPAQHHVTPVVPSSSGYQRVGRAFLAELLNRVKARGLRAGTAVAFFKVHLAQEAAPWPIEAILRAENTQP